MAALPLSASGGGGQYFIVPRPAPAAASTSPGGGSLNHRVRALREHMASIDVRLQGNARWRPDMMALLRMPGLPEPIPVIAPPRPAAPVVDPASGAPLTPALLAWQAETALKASRLAVARANARLHTTSLVRIQRAVRAWLVRVRWARDALGLPHSAPKGYARLLPVLRARRALLAMAPNARAVRGAPRTIRDGTATIIQRNYRGHLARRLRGALRAAAAAAAASHRGAAAAAHAQHMASLHARMLDDERARAERAQARLAAVVASSGGGAPAEPAVSVELPAPGSGGKPGKPAVHFGSGPRVIPVGAGPDAPVITLPAVLRLGGCTSGAAADSSRSSSDGPGSGTASPARRRPLPAAAATAAASSGGKPSRLAGGAAGSLRSPTASTSALTSPTALPSRTPPRLAHASTLPAAVGSAGSSGGNLPQTLTQHLAPNSTMRLSPVLESACSTDDEGALLAELPRLTPSAAGGAGRGVPTRRPAPVSARAPSSLAAAAGGGAHPSHPHHHWAMVPARDGEVQWRPVDDDVGGEEEGDEVLTVGSDTTTDDGSSFDSDGDGNGDDHQPAPYVGVDDISEEMLARVVAQSKARVEAASAAVRRRSSGGGDNLTPVAAEAPAAAAQRPRRRRRDAGVPLSRSATAPATAAAAAVTSPAPADASPARQQPAASPSAAAAAAKPQRPLPPAFPQTAAHVYVSDLPSYLQPSAATRIAPSALAAAVALQLAPAATAATGGSSPQQQQELPLPAAKARVPTRLLAAFPATGPIPLDAFIADVDDDAGSTATSLSAAAATGGSVGRWAAALQGMRVLSEDETHVSKLAGLPAPSALAPLLVPPPTAAAAAPSAESIAALLPPRHAELDAFLQRLEADAAQKARLLQHASAPPPVAASTAAHASLTAALPPPPAVPVLASRHAAPAPPAAASSVRATAGVAAAAADDGDDIAASVLAEVALDDRLRRQRLAAAQASLQRTAAGLRGAGGVPSPPPPPPSGPVQVQSLLARLPALPVQAPSSGARH